MTIYIDVLTGLMFDAPLGCTIEAEYDRNTLTARDANDNLYQAEYIESEHRMFLRFRKIPPMKKSA